MIKIGNDIVDLECSPKHKAQDQRFMQRVFTPQEQAAILKANDPETLLWLFWAAKEAAYKAISKIESPPVFSHKLFEVSMSPDKYWVVKYQEHIVKCFTHIVENKLVHVVCALSGTQTNISTFNTQCHQNIHAVSKEELQNWQNPANLENAFSINELESINHPESAIVRCKLKSDIEQQKHWPINKIEVIRPSKNKKMHPPYLLYQGNKTEIDISLSHHGAYVAWVASQYSTTAGI